MLSLREPLLALSLLVCLQAAATSCKQQWACYSVNESDNAVEFWVSNLKAFPFSATIGVETTNLRSKYANKDYYETTTVIEGNQRKLLLSLSKKQLGKDYRYSRNFFYWAPGRFDAKHDEFDYRKPFANDANYRLIQGFDGGYSHYGASRYAVDFAMPVGTAVHAARNGVVVDIEQSYDKGGDSRRFAKYANYIVILHSDGTTGEYYHLMHNGVTVAVGDKVNTGQQIGYSGNTGFSSMPHLHFAVYRAKSYGNFESLPFTFLP